MVEKRRFNKSQMLRIMTLSFAYMAMFLLPYIQYTFYMPMLEGLNVSNEQLGGLITMYAIACIVAYIPGGWMADRFSLKKILMISMAGNVVLCIIISMSFNYATALIVWPLLALSSGFASWAALVKGVSLTGTADEQGKVWGQYEFFDAFFGLVVSYLYLAIFAAVESTLGIKAVFLTISVISCISIVLLKVYFQDIAVEPSQKDEEKTKISDVIRVLKQPVVWYITIAIFSNYIVYAGMTYFTPYLSDVLGIGIVNAAGLMVLRSWGIRMLAGPTFGRAVDMNDGKASKVIAIGMTLTAIMIALFLMIPSSSSAILLIGVFFVATFVLLGSRGVMFATLEETKIPNNLRGLTVAVVSMIAYTPDLFIYQLFGKWLDLYGNGGYQMIFSSLIGASLITILCCILIYRANAKLKGNVKSW